MSLLLGNLTQQFVDITVIFIKAKSGDPEAIKAVPAAAAAFRKTAAKDASYLVYIGASLAPLVHGQSLTSYAPRCRNTRLHVHLYVCLGPYG